MPFVNFHAFRMLDPSKFVRFRTKKITTGVTVLVGPLKKPPLKKSGKGRVTGAVVQTYRFNKANFSFAQAKQWMKSHNIKYKRAEKAEGKSKTSKSESIKPPAITLGEMGRQLRERLRA